MTDTEKKRLANMAAKQRQEQADLIQQAYQLHCSNKQSGQTDGDQCLTRFTDIHHLKQGTFSLILNAWTQSADKSAVEDMFEIDHHIPFWTFIEKAVAAMTPDETEPDPQAEYLEIIEQMKTWVAGHTDDLRAIDEFNELTGRLAELLENK